MILFHVQGSIKNSPEDDGCYSVGFCGVVFTNDLRVERDSAYLDSGCITHILSILSPWIPQYRCKNDVWMLSSGTFTVMSSGSPDCLESTDQLFPLLLVYNR